MKRLRLLISIGWVWMVLLAACQTVPFVEQTAVATTFSQQAVTPTISSTVRPTMRLTEEVAFTNNQFDQSLCVLPCWFGIVPGETSFNDAMLLAKNGGMSPKILEVEGGEFEQAFSAETHVEPSFAIYVVAMANQGVVQRLQVQIDDLDQEKTPFEEGFDAYQVKQIIERYGPPDKVFFDFVPDAPTPGPFPRIYLPYRLLLLYEREGFSITYSGMTLFKETISICPSFEENKIDRMDILIQQKGASDSWLLPPYRKRWLSLEEMNGMGMQAFYDLFDAQNPKPCFEISYDALQPAKVDAPGNGLTATASPSLLSGTNDAVSLTCPSMLATIPSGETLPGQLILYRNPVHEFVSAQTGKSLGEYPGELWLFAGRDAYQPLIAPNRQWMLVFKERDSIIPKCHVALVPLSLQQKQSAHCLDAVVPRNTFVNWVNDEWLHVRKHFLDGSPDQEWWVNPWTLEIRSFAEGEYPAAYEKSRQRLLSFSPDFSRVVYLGNGSYGRGDRVVLWDLEQKQALMEQELPRFFSMDLSLQEWQKWSADGEQWLFVMPEEVGKDQIGYDLVLFDHNGQVVAQTEGEFLSIAQFSWSPDGERVAFVYYKRGATVALPTVAIWNWRTGEVYTLCIPGQGTGDRVYGELIWSPDSRYLTMGSCVSNSSKYSGCQNTTIWLWDSLTGWVAPWFEGDVYLDAWYEPAP